MGASLVQRLTKDGHKCVVYDVNSTAVKKIVGRGVQVAVSLDERRSSRIRISVNSLNGCRTHERDDGRSRLLSTKPCQSLF